MMLAIPLEATPPSEQAASATLTVGRRKVLGETKASVTKSGTRSSAHDAPTSIAASSRSTQEDVFGSGSDAAPPRSKPNARLQIFVDPFGEGAQAQAAEDAAATPWSELGTRKERTKENVPKVSKVNGSTLRQPGRQLRVASAPAASSSRIPVFRDPASGERGTMPPPNAQRRGKEKEAVPKTPARAVDVDEMKAIPATPRFVPFKDEVVSVCMLQHGRLRSQREIQPSTPSTTSCGAQGAQVPDSVMKVKAGTTGQLTSSEAEALRKDPFKNYPDKPSDTV